MFREQSCYTFFDVTHGVMLCRFMFLKHLSAIFASPVCFPENKELELRVVGLGIYFVPVKIIFILVYLTRAIFSTFVSF